MSLRVNCWWIIEFECILIPCIWRPFSNVSHGWFLFTSNSLFYNVVIWLKRESNEIKSLVCHNLQMFYWSIGHTWSGSRCVCVSKIFWSNKISLTKYMEHPFRWLKRNWKQKSKYMIMSAFYLFLPIKPNYRFETNYLKVFRNLFYQMTCIDQLKLQLLWGFFLLISIRITKKWVTRFSFAVG